jgi:hypothetical protein
LNEVTHADHKLVKREPIDLVQRWRRQPSAANGNRDPDMNRRRRLEFALAVEAVERGEAAHRQSDGLDGKRADQQTIIGCSRLVRATDPLFGRSDVDLVLEIVVGDFPLGSRHCGRDCCPHSVEVEADGSLFLGPRRKTMQLVLDVGVYHRPAGSGARNRGKINTTLFCEPPRGGRHPRTGLGWHATPRGFRRGWY